jgi:hypothetical protein
MVAYKYRGGPVNFSRDLDTIASDCFYAASLDSLNDPFEATYSAEPIEKLLGFVELIVGENPEFIDLKASWRKVLSNVAKAGIFSLASRPDDRKLWAHYGSNYTGFCVGYEVELLEKFNSYAHHTHYLIKVKYDEQPAVLGFLDVIERNLPSFLQKVLGTKHPEWKHESETRIITDKTGLMPHDFRAVRSIHFGLNMPQEQIDAVMQRMQGRGVAYYRMQRSSTYLLNAMPIADPFIDAPRYLYRIAPTTSYALDTYTDGEEKLAILPYLDKAVEIQRRDPYCTEVSFAERCTAEDRQGQIFVSYFYGIQAYNRYFTKEEIDTLYAQITDIEA